MRYLKSIKREFQIAAKDFYKEDIEGKSFMIFTTIMVLLLGGMLLTFVGLFLWSMWLLATTKTLIFVSVLAGVGLATLLLYLFNRYGKKLTEPTTTLQIIYFDELDDHPVLQYFTSEQYAAKILSGLGSPPDPSIFTQQTTAIPEELID